MPLEDVTNVHFVAAKRKRQNEKLQKNMPQFPFSITFSAAEMCAKFKGRGRRPEELLFNSVYYSLLEEAKESINFSL